MSNRERRMNAYYYAFNPTGIDEVDKILSAVACAGKAYHHTNGWTDDCPPYEDFTGDCPADWIQNAANEAAKAMRHLLEGEHKYGFHKNHGRGV